MQGTPDPSGSDLFALVNGLPALLAVVDRDERYVMINDAFADFFGHSARDIQSMHARDVLGEERYRNAEPHIRLALSGTEAKYFIQVPDRHGDQRWIDVTYAPHRDVSGEIIGSLVMVITIDDRVRIERERQRLRDSLAHSAQMESLGRLAAGAAHELNNLMALQFLAIDRAIELQASPDGVAALDAIHDVASRAAALTKDLLAFGRQGVTGRSVDDLGQVVESLVGLVVATFADDAHNDHISLELRRPDHPVWVDVDEGRFSQAVLNLIVNARDGLGESGTICCAVAQCPSTNVPAAHLVGRSTWPADEMVAKVTITDDGEGLDADDVERIFAPYYPTRDAPAGYGMGLSSTKEIVEELGGAISVESSTEAGTAITVWLPLAEAGSSDGDLHTIASDTATASILICDDYELVLDMCRSTLEREGFAVTAVSQPLQALTTLANEPQRFDLLIADVMMSEMDGITLARSVAGVRADLPVLFLSGFAEPPSLDSHATGLVWAMLEKPFSPADLVAEVKKLVGPPNS